ncbi:Cof-type HAD-IIB family hydrolase [Weissella viridescens]|uniref:HAD-IIB family hydrolase n=1 Tax=Weissella viridescens TaxID=1629 RepID=UPI001C7D971F|nr:HAD family hydrolase [Weissella viridescens]MBX4172133.1 Cof-type HAD-IIB family hydrolase [Weissella viridescens]
MKKLIAIDLDHTTLNEAGQVSDYTIAVLQALQAQGDVVAIVTGRSPRVSEPIYRQIGLTSPLMTFNGGLGFKPNTSWDGEYSITFSSEILYRIMIAFDVHHIQGIAGENREDAWGRTERIVLSPEEQIFFPMSVKERRLLTIDNLPARFNEVLFYIAPEYQPAFVNFVRETYGDQDVEAVPWGQGSSIVSLRMQYVNKYMALTALQKAYDIEPDQVYAFGDEMNDYEMLRGAAHGILMKNGNRKLEPVVEAVTRKTNDEDGLADYIENVLKLV